VESLPQNKLNGHGKEEIIGEISFGLGGILFGLVFIAIVMAVLNYFNIISLFPFFKQPVTTTKSAVVMPQSGSVDKKLLKNKEQINLLAEKAGWKIDFAFAIDGDYYDNNGRYVLASKERVVDGWTTDQFGWQALPGKKVTKAFGIFSKWENIPESKDRYLEFFIDKMFSKKDKVRVVFKNGSASSVSSLKVENLDYGPLNNKINPVDTIGNFGEILESDLSKLIVSRDIVSIDVKGKSIKEMHRDENGLPIAQSLQIRRFGGIETINKELITNDD